MILRNGPGYFIEQINEDGLKITRINLDDGHKIISIADPRIRQSSIRIEIKDLERIPWRYLLNFNLEEIANMPLKDAKKYVWRKWKNEQTRKNMVQP